MKIMAFSDLHHAPDRAEVLVQASAQADLVLAAGDFCNHRNRLDDAIALLDGLAAPVIAVPGNAESAEELTQAAPDWTVLHGSGTTFDGVTIFGLGYAVPRTPFGEWSCDLDEAEAQTLLDTCTAADILLIHAPPKGIADIASTGQSLGSTAIRAAVARVQPRLLLCGHIHDCWGERGHIGASEVVNLGPTPNWFQWDT